VSSMEPQRKRKQFEPPSLWWLGHRQYLAYTLRELSSFFIILYVLLFSISMFQLKLGEASYQAYERLLTSPPFIVLSILILAFSVYHSITWFKVTPTALPPIRVNGGKMPGWVLVAVQVYLWPLISYVLYVWIYAR